MTSRNKKVLVNSREKIYHVKCLSDDESIQLFSLCAFRKHCPPDNWMDLSRLATSYCKGNPLVLRVLGGTLLSEDRHYWESFLSGLRLTENPEIHNILRRSYDKMGAEEKRLFLDVACLLHGLSRSRLVEYMATRYPSAYAKVKDLIDKSLLICVFNKGVEKIEVHCLLKEMAWNIVHEEPKLGKRSRLVDPNDIHKLLTTREVRNWKTFVLNLLKVIGMDMVLPKRKRRQITGVHPKGTDALEVDRGTEGISLDLSKAKEMYLEANAFEGMDSLTFLKFWWPSSFLTDFRTEKKIHLPSSGLDSLPGGLRYLHWDGYPLRSLPLRFYPEHLVHLIIRHSPIKRCWEGFDNPTLVNLMVLDLSYCINLTAIPDLSKSSKLEELLLWKCGSLVELPTHVQYLDKLITLDLRHCVNLERLPPKLNSKFLKHVWMCRCPKVTHCPEIDSGELEELYLLGTPVKELPSAVFKVKHGGGVHLCGENITSFPAISASLQEFRLYHTAIGEIGFDDHQVSSELFPSFNQLELVDNLQLKNLPRSIWNLVSHTLSVEGSPLIECFPEISEPVEVLPKYASTERGRPKIVPYSMKALSFLNFRDTGIKSLPSCIQELDQLVQVDLSYSRNLESVTCNIHKLSKLAVLYLRGCRSIQTLPELPPNLHVLDVVGCKSLPALPSNSGKLNWGSLDFCDCHKLDSTLPDEIVENFSKHAMLSGHHKGGLLYSGSEIPDWFAYRNTDHTDGSYVTVQLPPANCSSEQLNIEGIVFGVVFSREPIDDFVTINCECVIDNTAITFWVSSTLSLDGVDTSSDCVHLWFDSNLLGEAEESEEGQEWYLKYAGRTVSFRFYPQVAGLRLENSEIKRCGVSLLC